MKKRRTGLIIIGIIVIVLLLGVGIYFMIPKGLSEKDILESPETAVATCSQDAPEKQAGCYLLIAEVLATENPDIALQACLAINNNQNEGDRKNCIEDLANKQTDQSKAVEICSAFGSDSKTREHCFGRIVANFGEINTDSQLSMCGLKTGSDQDGCYRNIAEEFISMNVSKSVEICKKIQNINSRDDCLSYVVSTPEVVKAYPDLAVSVCDSLALKSRCYTDVARTISGSDPKQAAEVCKKLSDDVQISDCYGNVWFTFSDVVAKEIDFTISLCNVLTLKKDDCLRRLVGVIIDTDRTKAEEVCNLMSSSAKSGCLTEVRR